MKGINRIVALAQLKSLGFCNLGSASVLMNAIKFMEKKETNEKQI